MYYRFRTDGRIKSSVCHVTQLRVESGRYGGVYMRVLSLIVYRVSERQRLSAV